MEPFPTKVLFINSWFMLQSNIAISSFNVELCLVLSVSTEAIEATVKYILGRTKSTAGVKQVPLDKHH